VRNPVSYERTTLRVSVIKELEGERLRKNEDAAINGEDLCNKV
jgi:hypothetical protein